MFIIYTMSEKPNPRIHKSVPIKCPAQSPGGAPGLPVGWTDAGPRAGDLLSSPLCSLSLSPSFLFSFILSFLFLLEDGAQHTSFYVLFANKAIKLCKLFFFPPFWLLPFFFNHGHL